MRSPFGFLLLFMSFSCTPLAIPESLTFTEGDEGKSQNAKPPGEEGTEKPGTDVPGSDSGASDAVADADAVDAATDSSASTDSAVAAETSSPDVVAKPCARVVGCNNDHKCEPGCEEDKISCPCDCDLGVASLWTFGDNECNKLCESYLTSFDCCFCGDGKCLNFGVCTDTTMCVESGECFKACGNKICEPGETTSKEVLKPGQVVCDEDCNNSSCGNGACNFSENPDICAKDCGTACGNCVCEPGEKCEVDCPVCGDGICTTCPNNDESKACPADCKK